MSDVHDASYYAKCMMGGTLACGLTHAIICPLDIVKCRKQVRIEPSEQTELTLIPLSSLLFYSKP